MSEEANKPLRHGYTTGACATAVTKAALLALITNEPPNEVTIHLPVGKDATFEIVRCEIGDDSVEAETIKDGGDDPDATHLARIIARVSWRKVEGAGIHLDGGIGVGRVTKPGLLVPVGEAAINPVPRKMIYGVAEELLKKFGSRWGVDIVISVPDGEEIAKKTLNGRLGIIGGISILGTRGTVVPFSTAAYKASIVQAISVAITSGCSQLVLTTGGRSEKYAMAMYPELPEEAFIEMGDFVGFAVKQAKKQGAAKISLVGMMGKFSKVAQGVMMVHSKSAPIDFGFLADLARKSGASEELVSEVEQANTASQVGDLMMEHRIFGFFEHLCEACCRETMKEAGGEVEIETTLFTLKGERLGEAVLHDGLEKSNRDRG